MTDLLEDPVSIAVAAVALLLLLGPAAWSAISWVWRFLFKSKPKTARVIVELLSIREATPEISGEINAAIQKLLEK